MLFIFIETQSISIRPFERLNKLYYGKFKQINNNNNNNDKIQEKIMRCSILTVIFKLAIVLKIVHRKLR